MSLVVLHKLLELGRRFRLKIDPGGRECLIGPNYILTSVYVLPFWSSSNTYNVRFIWNGPRGLKDIECDAVCWNIVGREEKWEYPRNDGRIT